MAKSQLRDSEEGHCRQYTQVQSLDPNQIGMRWQKQISSVHHKWLISLMAILLRVTLCRQQVGFEIFRVDKMVDMILLRVIFVTFVSRAVWF